MMVQQSGLKSGKLDRYFNLWGEPNLFRHDVGFHAEDEFNSAANLVQVHAEVARYASSNTFPFACEAEEKVFSVDVVMLKAPRLFLSARENLADLLCECVKPLFAHFHNARAEVS